MAGNGVNGFRRESKVLHAWACLLLLAGSVQALTFSLNKNSFYKGEEMLVTGTASGLVTVSAASGEKQVFERKIPLDPDSNAFRFTRQVSMLDPKGSWDVQVSDLNSSERREVIVNPTRESEFLVLTFLSPSQGAYARTSSVGMAVRVTDAGKAVTDGIVHAWDAAGAKIRLNNNGDGTYSTTYKIPPAARAGRWNLKVTAIRESMPEEIGGENSVDLEVVETPLLVDVLEPRVEEFEVGKAISLKLKLSYPDGGTVTNASVVVTANYQLLSLKGEGLGIYSARFVPEVSEEELVEIRVEAKDAAGNSGQKRLNLKPSGYWMHVVKENAVFYFFPLLFIFYILLLTVKEIRFFLGRTGLRGKKQQLLLLKKKLQEDFYAKNVVSKQTYDLRNAELNTELNEVRAKLDLIEQKGG
ncbi:MAG TPA: hypothetical protein HA252_02300 [Candidatus Diapherotrites archaeon]|uniref:Uncharacterized protein n=1 Tax=Candidatus Iainarchaeum sp. TaxID=3101447 RepID=A0A7J4JEN0_9ARCH|nr:hypothetical protein [Candidatus Diapherotrites archaeon]